MDTTTLSNILWMLAPGHGFSIRGSVENEAAFNQNVVYEDTTKKPSWAQVQGGEDAEQWVQIRGLRSSKLLICDWTVLTDVPFSTEKTDEWEPYRQELRDITDQPDPFNINWPTPPE